MTIRLVSLTTYFARRFCDLTRRCVGATVPGQASLAEALFSQCVATDEFAVLHGLYWLTVNLVEQHPLAVLVDDLPWADQSSQRFFAYLAERLDDLPVALVVTIRTGDPGSESASIGSV